MEVGKDLRRLLGGFPRLEAALRALWHQKRIWFRRSEGERILRQNFRKVHGRELDLRNARTFSEKLSRRMILMNREDRCQYTDLTDKYLVRNFVAAKVGERYLTKLYWQGVDPRQIPFDSLPEQYVIKTNHGSKQVIVVNGPVNTEAVFAKLDVWLRINYYWREREFQYFGIRPRVFIEEYLNDSVDGGPLDYRFWCFNGSPELIQVDNHSHDINPFFDPNWNLLDLHYRKAALRQPVEKPPNLDEMLHVARALSAEFDFVRVDLYNINGRICFGELTFTPVAGRLRLMPPTWDDRLGQIWVTS
jgi:hypothetical protein